MNEWQLPEMIKVSTITLTMMLDCVGPSRCHWLISWSCHITKKNKTSSSSQTQWIASLITSSNIESLWTFNFLGINYFSREKLNLIDLNGHAGVMKYLNYFPSFFALHSRCNDAFFTTVGLIKESILFQYFWHRFILNNLLIFPSGCQTWKPH